MPPLKKTRIISASGSNNEIDVVLSSSGVRAAVFIGCLRALHEKGYEVKRIAGTSGGAIIAAGYALGKTLDELEEQAKAVDYPGLRDFRIKNLASLKNPSLYSGKPLDDLFKRLFENATIRDFQIDCKITVVTVGGRRRRIVIDRNTHPDLPVWEAVRMSSSIPFIFPYLKLDGVPVTDGGLVVFDNFDIFPENARPSICLRPKSGATRADLGEDSLLERKVFLWTLVKAVMDYLVDAIDNQIEISNEWEKTIPIPTGSISALNFNITAEDVERLIEYGYNAVMQANCVPALDIT